MEKVGFELKFEKIEERDVDFVIMRTIVECSAVADLFLRAAGYDMGRLTSVEHSVMDNEFGETDVLAKFAVDEKKIAVLIEDKIDAKEMLEQCSRYLRRGEKGKDQGLYDEFVVVLVAPQEYLNTNKEAQKYSKTISYEKLLEILQMDGRVFDCAILKNAIEKQKRGYIVREVHSITEFWGKLKSYCDSSGKRIEMFEPRGAKGARSLWVGFKSSLPETEIYFKSDKGFCDLQFNGKFLERERLIKELYQHIPFGKDIKWEWEETGNSLSLRIQVKKIDFQKPFESYMLELNEMVDAIEKLAEFSRYLNQIGYEI